MKHKEILEKAIQKAIDGGWDDGREFFFTTNGKDFSISQLSSGHLIRSDDVVSVPEIIFNHDFAKALWGEEEYALDDLGEWHEPPTPDYIFVFTTPAWAYHLQQMVIAEDPIKYLGENI